jgi:hypothetical protein
VVITTPRPLCPRERPGTHCTGSWVVPGPVWTCAKNLALTGIRFPDRPAPIQSSMKGSWDILNKQSRSADRGWSSSLGSWARCQQLLVINTYHVKNRSQKPRTRIDLLNFRNWDVGVRTGSIWLRIGTGGGHL